MRKIIFACVLLLAIGFVVLRFSELQNILDTLHHSNYRFLIAAVVIELIWFYNSATVYSVLYRLVGLKRLVPTLSWWQQQPILLMWLPLAWELAGWQFFLTMHIGGTTQPVG